MLEILHVFIVAMRNLMFISLGILRLTERKRCFFLLLSDEMSLKLSLSLSLTVNASTERIIRRLDEHSCGLFGGDEPVVSLVLEGDRSAVDLACERKSLSAIVFSFVSLSSFGYFLLLVLDATASV